MRIFLSFIVSLLSLFIIASPIQAQYYGEGGYYSEGAYYGEGGYDGGGGGYSEGGYGGYTQSGYASAPGPFNQNQPLGSCNGATPQIVLSWTSSQNATSYTVYYQDMAVGSQVTGPTTSGTSYTLTTANGFIVGHQYSFFIQASNSVGVSYSDLPGPLWSHVKFAVATTMPSCTPPTIAQNQPVADCTGPSNGPKISLSWSSSGGTSFDVNYRLAGTSNPTLLGTTTAYSWDITSGLTVGSQYDFQIVAINSFGTNPSLWSQARYGSYTTYPNCAAPPLPAITFSASPTSIFTGQSSTLTWSTTNVDVNGCSGTNGWSGTKAASGSQSVSPGATTTYGLTCTGPGGSASASATVTVSNSPPTATLTVDTPTGSCIPTSTTP